MVGGLYGYVAFTFTPMFLSFQNFVPTDLQEQITTEAVTEIAMWIKVVSISVFLLFGAIGFWWAYLFSSRPIKELFGSPAATGSRSFNVSVVGWYFIMNAILGVWSLWRGVRYGHPITMEFGSLLVGWSALAVRAAYTAVQLLLAGGLLRKGEQSRRLTIYYLLFTCLNVIVFLIRPGREARIAAYRDMLVASFPAFGMYSSTTSWSHYMKTASIEWIFFAVIAVWFLAKQNNTPDHAKP